MPIALSVALSHPAPCLIYRRINNKLESPLCLFFFP